MNENELQRSINARVTAQTPSYAWDSTVGIVIAHNDAVHQFGTGTLFAVADHFFVVTAGHVIKQASKHKKTLAITSAGSHFVPVVNDWQVTSGGQYGSIDDPLDVAIYRLQPDAVGDLKSPIESWGSETSRIVGVETSVYHSRQAIKVSRWVAVSTLIHASYPAVRPVFDMWRIR